MAPYRPGMLGDDEDAMAAVRALVRAEDAVDDAVRLLLDAEAVHWTGPGAARYRRRLEDTTDAVRRTRGVLREATGAVSEHAASRLVEPHGAPAPGTGWPELPRWALPSPGLPRLAPSRSTFPASASASASELFP